MEDDYSIEALYAQDPVAATNAVIAEAAATVAEELAAYTGSQHAAELQRVRAGQSESAAITAIDEIERKYGADEWARLQPRVEERTGPDTTPHPQRGSHVTYGLWPVTRGRVQARPW